jgi:hypothetical protein
MHIFGFDTDKAWDYENGYYLTSPVTRLAKAVAHYELYKSIIGLPGHVVECGVFKGASLIRWATYREILESRDSRLIIGFDAFGKFPDQGNIEDVRFALQWEQDCGEGISTDELTRVLLSKGITNYELIKGNINAEIPRYRSRNSALKIALLHLDVDVYSASQTVLEYLWPCVVPGGLLVMDDYGTIPGETRAVDEYFAGQDVEIRKLPISHVPAFIRKESRHAAINRFCNKFDRDLGDALDMIKNHSMKGDGK